MSLLTSVESEDDKTVFPFEITSLDEETTKQMLKDFTGIRAGFVQVGPKKYIFPQKYLHEAQHIYNFPVRKDDVWIVTFPRSGTTWTQEMVWLLCNNLDYEGAARVPLLQRVPYFESFLFVHKDLKTELLERNRCHAENTQIVEGYGLPVWDKLQKMSGRRYIKTHLPFSLLPPSLLTSGCKIIYVARNPKDVSVSYYHLNRLMLAQGFKKDWKTYWEYFSNNLQPYTPYWEHIKEGYEQRHNPNVLFMFYEDINKSVPQTLKRLANFLDVPEPEQMAKLEDHLNIQNFRNNKSVNMDVLDKVGMLVNGEEGFIRQGKTGKNKEYFEKELSEKYEEWLENNRKNVIDLSFPL